MSSGIVFVEGDYDYRIMVQIAPTGILVVRGAGKNGQRAFMQGYEKAQAATASRVLIGFRDRDFDRAIPEKAGLDLVGNIFFSHRRTIENYLLRPENFASYISATNSAKFQGLTEAVVHDLLIESAKELKFYQAARQSLGEVRVSNDLGTTWTSGSGALPDHLGADDCLSSSLSLLTDYAQKAGLISDTARFHALYQDYCERFNDAFFEARLHEVWFQAKDVQKVLQKKITAIWPQFSISRVYEHAISNFDPTPFPDLMEFVNWVSQKIEQQ
jgi:hypothetical protein